MISVLVVTDSGRHEPLPPVDPSVEVLHAGGLEEALEKLGRNRRIDAVLLLAGRHNASIAAAIQEDNPAPPPIFSVEPDTPRGTRGLPPGSAADCVNRLILEIS